MESRLVWLSLWPTDWLVLASYTRLVLSYWMQPRERTASMDPLQSVATSSTATISPSRTCMSLKASSKLSTVKQT